MRQVSGNTLQQVEKFKYLGVVFTSGRRRSEERWRSEERYTDWQGRNEGEMELSRGRRSEERYTDWQGRWNSAGGVEWLRGRRKVSTTSQVGCFINTANLLSKDLMLEHGISKLPSCPRCYLTSSLPCGLVKLTHLG